MRLRQSLSPPRAVGQLYFKFAPFWADTRAFATDNTGKRRVFFTDTGQLAARPAGLRGIGNTGAGGIPAPAAGFRFHGFTVPFGVIEIGIGFDEIIDGEIILTCLWLRWGCVEITPNHYQQNHSV